MPSNLFGAGDPSRYTHRSAAEVEADQKAAMREDANRRDTAHAAGRDRRSVGGSGR